MEEKNMAYRVVPLSVLAACSLLAGCSSRISSDLAQECSQGLSQAEAEMQKAKADGLGDAVSLGKAAGLLTAAAIQKQFEKYPNCIDKVQRARAYIADARRN
jgi:uncharacterized protein YceK